MSKVDDLKAFLAKDVGDGGTVRDDMPERDGLVVDAVLELSDRLDKFSTNVIPAASRPDFAPKA